MFSPTQSMLSAMRSSETASGKESDVSRVSQTQYGRLVNAAALQAACAPVSFETAGASAAAMVAHAPQEYGKKAVNPWVKGLITGPLVICEMLLGGLWMENMKMEKQRTELPYPVLFRKVAKQGWRGFQAGLLPWGVLLGFAKGTVLGGAKAKLDHATQGLPVSPFVQQQLAGFGAGACQGVAMSPLLLARTRVNQELTNRKNTVKMTGREEIMASFRIIPNMIRQEGPMAIFQGMPLMICKRAMDWGTRFFFITQVKNAMLEHNNGEPLSRTQLLFSSLLGGGVSVALTMPIDRSLPVIQAEGGGSMFQRLGKVFSNARNNPTTLFRGWQMRTVHTAYHTVFAVFISQQIYDHFFREMLEN